MSGQRTPGPWFVRKRERDGELLDCFVAAKDVNGFAYDAEILGDDEYRDDVARKLADCEAIAVSVNAHDDLVAALRQAEKWIAQQMRDNGCPAERLATPPEGSHLFNIRAALGKATGAQS